MAFTVTETEYKQIPENTPQPAVLESLEQKTVPYTDKQTGESKTFTKLEWWFKITGGEHQGRKVKGETSAVIDNHPNNQFRQWVEGLLGQEIPVGFSFEEDDLIGLPCEITVRHNVVTKNGEERVYENVNGVAQRSTFDEPPF